MEILIKHVSNLLVPGELSRVFFDSARKSGIYEHVSFLFAAFFVAGWAIPTELCRDGLSSM